MNWGSGNDTVRTAGRYMIVLGMFATLLAIGACVVPVHANESADVGGVEDVVKRLEQRVEALENGSGKPNELNAYFKQGIRLDSADGSFKLKIGGRIQNDWVWFDQDSDLSALPLASSGVEGLSVLTSGPLPQNPSVLLGSDRMEEVIAALVEQADLVLFDAPPVLAVTDAALLAARVDGTLLIVRVGSTRRDHVQQAKVLLEKVNAHLVGAALTNAGLHSSVSSYYE